MDNRTSRSKKSKTRTPRPYDRQNQSILGKVASKVKGILYPSWLSSWMSSGGETSSNEPQGEESADEEEVLPQCGAKRRRLLQEHIPPSILSEGTQTWLDTPSSSNIFNQAPCMSSTVTQDTLIQNKESAVIMNGDDHSENSEESASTSGCSSLVSHKDRANCLSGSRVRMRETELDSLHGQLKGRMGLKNRQDSTSQNLSAHSSSRRLSLWSESDRFSPASKLQGRSPSVVQTNQPGFNVGAFVGPCKKNQLNESKISSPFYQGKTTFGGASSIRRMPISVAPYQVDKPLRNQIKVRSNQSDDTLEGMSSAAKRILLTLEKMSSPVIDAKKMPNTNKSPVDLSLYLMPPKHRSNVSTTVGGTKGPPIVNISTISKLTTLKSCGVRRFQNSPMEKLPVQSDERLPVLSEAMPSDLVLSSHFSGPKSGGGKMRTKLTQQHQPPASMPVESLEQPLPNVPLPISTLPTFNFDIKSNGKCSYMNDTKMIGKDFVFSNPIEVLPKQSVPPAFVEFMDKLSQFGPKADKNNLEENVGFTFSRPIEPDIPFPLTSTPSVNNSSVTWECSTCLVRNPTKESKCMACEMPRNSLSSVGQTLSTTTTQAGFASSLSNSSSTWECGSCWIRNPQKEQKCLACETPRPIVSASTSVKTTTSGFGAVFTNPPSTWECSGCWIRNSTNDIKCIVCETPRNTESIPAASSSEVSTTTTKTDSGFGEKLGSPPLTWECSACWVRNPAKETKCMACETPNPSKTSGNICDISKAVSSSTNSPFVLAPSTSSNFFSPPSSCSTPSSGFKLPTSLNGSITTASFGGFKIPVPKSSLPESTTKTCTESKDSKQDSETDSMVSPVVTFSKSNAVSNLTPTTESTTSLKRGRDSEFSSKLNGPSNTPLLSQQSIEVVEVFSASSEKEKTKSGFSSKPNSTVSISASPATSGKPLFSETSTLVSTSWECDICSVRNSSGTRICSACETLKATEKHYSGLQDPSRFKFSSPLQSSPITFKFGTPSSITSQTDSITSTTTTQTFSFASSSTTNTSFFTSVSSASTINQKSLESSKSFPAVEPSAPKLPVSEFKFDVPKLPSADAAKPTIPVINLAEKESSDESKQSNDSNATAKKSSTEINLTVVTSTNKNFTFTNTFTDSKVSNSSFVSPSATKFSIQGPVSNPNYKPQTDDPKVPDSQKQPGNAISGQPTLPVGGFNFKMPSPPTSLASGFSMPLINKPKSDNETPVEKAPDQKTEIPKFSDVASEMGKASTPFILGTSSQSAASPFTLTTTTPSVFKFGGDSAETPKSSAEASSLIKSAFTATPVSSSTSSIAPTFSFGSNSTGTFPLVPKTTSQNTSLPSGLLQFQSNPGKNQDTKSVASVAPFCSTATSTNTFTFGDSTAVTTQPSVSSGFSFFSATATTTTPSSNLFTFGASSQAPKPGGFTFKSGNEDKTNPTSTTSLNFGVPTATSTTSSVFKFGTSVPASTGGFVFGAPVKTEPVSAAAPASFSFGTGTTTTSSSTFSGFQPPQTAPVFQFGAQPSTGASPAPQFGTPNSNFTFGSKSDTATPLGHPSATPQAPASAFGCTPMQPMFGSTPTAPFGKSDSKPTFNFGAAAPAATPVFQFGNTEKKQATVGAQQFTFGAPTQEAATSSNSFQPQFNISTPPSFNFGAAATQSGPFQFVGSTDPVNQSSAPRKIRKAVRRVLPKH